MKNILEHQAITKPIKEEPLVPATSLESNQITDSEPIDHRLDVLADYLKQCRDNGIEVTPEMAQKEINDKLGLKISELLNQELTDPEIKEIDDQVIARITDMMEQKATDQKTTLSYLREKVFKSNFAKAAFVTAMLFLKFNSGQAAPDSVEDKDGQKVEFKKPVQLDGGDKNENYDSAKDFTHIEKVSIKAGSFFETDKADLKNQSELETKFNDFFSSISSDNFNEIISHNWIFASSSDDRPTSNWGGSNKNLSDARFESFLKMFEEVRSNHDFSGLSADQVKQILDKPILSVQPEGGETHITDLVNPETNKNFTAQEVAALSAGERAKLLEECRYANFEVESNMFEIGTYGQFILLVDNSPSMNNSKVNMADELKYINKDLPVKVGFFSESLSDLKELNSSQEAAQEIMKVASNGLKGERALSSTIQCLEEISADDISSKAMYVATDEGLQDFDQISKLIELAQKTNTTVNFLMFYENGSKFIKVSAQELLDKFKKNIESNALARQEALNNSIVSYEKKVASLVNDITNKIADGSFEASNIYTALDRDGIKGDKEQIKKTLLEIDFQNLKNLDHFYLGKKLVETKMNLEYNKDLLTNFQSIPAGLENLADSRSGSQTDKNVSLTTFEDGKGGVVTIPIF